MDEARAAAVAAFPIVGIGASAGGLEAFEAFFRACAADTGMAFVLVPHLDPGHQSLLTEILQRCTAMPVVQALDQVVLAPDHVYIIPPNRDMAILNGVVQLSVPEMMRGQRMPIDTFLRSLAEDQAERAIGIILSGTATDGTLGLRAILGAGGVCLVQEPSTAKYDGMPQSAIQAGYATHILPVEKMPATLLEVAQQAGFRQRVPAVATEKEVSGLNQVLLHLRSSTGHDFSLYKKSTIGRRIERRMAQHSIEGMAVYARFLKDNPDETQKLFKELLINVTNFFRDPNAFVVLKDAILPPMLADKPAGYVFRVWVAGCASGEEAYSIAIVLMELQEGIRAKHGTELSIQIYATDLDDDAVAAARAGRYPPNIAQDVTPERLRRFFTKDVAGYKVKKDLRDRVVFAVQSVIKDPPFTKLDLLSCRNLLIYLEPAQQDRLIPTFHYALKPGGVLFLSPSESIAGETGLFAALDRKWKFYRAIHSSASTHPQNANYLSWTADDNSKAPNEAMTKTREINFDELTRRVLLQSYAPASIVTDLKGNILYVYGDTGRFLRPAPGQATLNLIEMARDGLQPELRALVRNDPAQTAPTLNREVSVKTNGGFSTVSVSVRRIPAPPGGTGEDLLLVSFQDVAERIKPAARRKGGKGAVESAAQCNAEDLERDLAHARASQQAATEEQQAFNEELKSTNEELQSANEELQSSNEELETSREELQSLNEEMVTVNSELNATIERLSDVQNDLQNLLDSINTGTLFVDRQLVIRRYTPMAVKAYRLTASDIGRPLADIKSNLEGDDLLADLQAVLDTLIPIEREVRAVDGAWYLARMQPYRTLDNVIAGVVLTFTSVTDFKLASEAVRRSEERYRSLLDNLSAGVVVHAADTSILLANAAAASLLGLTQDQLLGKTAVDPAWGFVQEDGTPMLLKDYPVNRVIASGESLRNYVVGVPRTDRTEPAWLLCNAYPVRDEVDRTLQVVVTFTDITERMQAEEITKAAFQYNRSLIEASLDPLVAIGAEGRITDVNTATEQVTGAARNKLVGSDFADYFTDPEKAREGYRQVFSQGFVADYPLAIRHANGKITDVLYSASLYRDATGHVRGVFAAARDVTESRAAERLKLGVVQMARDLAEGIVNAVSEPLIVLDGALQVVFAGRSFYQHFRVTKEDTVGRRIYDLGNGQWNIPVLRRLLEDLLPQKQVLDGYVVEHDFPGLGLRRMVLNARRIVTAMGHTELILLAMVAIEPLEKP